MKCEICGKEFSKRQYYEPYEKICSSECFDKKFWFDRIKDKNDSKSVIINHHAYWIGDENDKSSFRGYDGHKFVIKFFNGRQITTTNLCDNGDLPKEFWVKLPDNAEFIAR